MKIIYFLIFALSLPHFSMSGNCFQEHMLKCFYQEEYFDGLLPSLPIILPTKDVLQEIFVTCFDEEIAFLERRELTKDQLLFGLLRLHKDRSIALFPVVDAIMKKSIVCRNEYKGPGRMLCSKKLMSFAKKREALLSDEMM